MFSTTKRKVEATEKYDIPVLTQYALTKEGERSTSVFGLNKAAMEAFEFKMNTPLVNKIANGYDEENNLVLAATDTDDTYTSNVTAKNTFSSKKLLNRLMQDYGINPEEEHEFLIIIDKPENGPIMGLIALIRDEGTELDTLEDTKSIEDVQTGYVAEEEPVACNDGEGAVYTPEPAVFNQPIVENTVTPHVVRIDEF